MRIFSWKVQSKKKTLINQLFTRITTREWEKISHTQAPQYYTSVERAETSETSLSPQFKLSACLWRRKIVRLTFLRLIKFQKAILNFIINNLIRDI